MDIVSAVFASVSICAVIASFKVGYSIGLRCGGENPKRATTFKLGIKKKAEKIPQNEEMEKLLGGISNILRYDGNKQD